MSEALARIADYLRIAGLESLGRRQADVERAVRDLLEAMGEKVAVGDAGTLYTYPVPMLTEDGTCSIVDEMAPVPYDLGAILGGRTRADHAPPGAARAAGRARAGNHRRRLDRHLPAARSIPRACRCW